MLAPSHCSIKYLFKMKSKLICKILVLPRCYMKVMNGRDVYFYGRLCYILLARYPANESRISYVGNAVRLF